MSSAVFNLSNFDPSSPSLLLTPRSTAACKQCGIDPADLLYSTSQSSFLSNPPRSPSPSSASKGAQEIQKAAEKLRVKRLKQCRQQWDLIREKERGGDNNDTDDNDNGNHTDPDADPLSSSSHLQHHLNSIQSRHSRISRHLIEKQRRDITEHISGVLKTIVGAKREEDRGKMREQLIERRIIQKYIKNQQNEEKKEKYTEFQQQTQEQKDKEYQRREEERKQQEEELKMKHDMEHQRRKEEISKKNDERQRKLQEKQDLDNIQQQSKQQQVDAKLAKIEEIKEKKRTASKSPQRPRTASMIDDESDNNASKDDVNEEKYQQFQAKQEELQRIAQELEEKRRSEWDAKKAERDVKRREVKERNKMGQEQWKTAMEQQIQEKQQYLQRKEAEKLHRSQEVKDQSLIKSHIKAVEREEWKRQHTSLLVHKKEEWGNKMEETRKKQELIQRERDRAKEESQRLIREKQREKEVLLAKLSREKMKHLHSSGSPVKSPTGKSGGLSFTIDDLNDPERLLERLKALGIKEEMIKQDGTLRRALGLGNDGNPAGREEKSRSGPVGLSGSGTVSSTVVMSNTTTRRTSAGPSSSAKKPQSAPAKRGKARALSSTQPVIPTPQQAATSLLSAPIMSGSSSGLLKPTVWSRAEKEEYINEIARDQNYQMELIMEMEQEKEQERRETLKKVKDEEERERLKKIFEMEREKSNDTMKKIAREHQVNIGKKMEELGLA